MAKKLTFACHHLPIALLLCMSTTLIAQPNIKQLLYGVAYYDEYMPYDRLDKDITMMHAAGINVVRIAESTWAQLNRKKAFSTLPT